MTQQHGRHGGFGYIPDPIDVRDRPFMRAVRVARPDSVDLRRTGGVVYDQGYLGSCVWNATLGMISDNQPNDELLSRLFGYYKTRVYERTTREDAGCTARNALKMLAKYGCCDEAKWPYDPTKFATRPPPKAYRDAKDQIIDAYERIPAGLDAILDALAMGKDFVIGLALYPSFDTDEVARTGMVRMPSEADQRWAIEQNGGWPWYHEMRVLGYQMRSKVLIVRNSWGPQWGDGGDCYLPFDYGAHPKLVIDNWTVTLSHQKGA